MHDYLYGAEPFCSHTFQHELISYFCHFFTSPVEVFPMHAAIQEMLSSGTGILWSNWQNRVLIISSNNIRHAGPESRETVHVCTSDLAAALPRIIKGCLKQKQNVP